MLEKILVATDGSENAQRALTFAGAMASRFDSELKVLYVFSPAVMDDATRHLAEVEHLLPKKRPQSSLNLEVTQGTPLDAEPSADPSEIGVMYQAAEQVAQVLADDGGRIAKRAGATKVTPVVRSGDPTESILAYADEEKVDLIVVGTRGLGTLAGLIMGSVSSKVSHHAPCCCLIVK